VGDGRFSPTGLRNNINPAVTIDAVSRDLRTPYQDEWRINFERELWTETSVRVEYINRKYRDQLQDTDLNHLPGDFGKCRVANLSQPAALAASPGSGQEIEDPFTHEIYIDTDPGDGDGIMDDCVGKIEVPREQIGDDTGGTGGEFGDDPLTSRLDRPDGVPDLYTQNPAWGSIFLVGNFNSSDYEAFVVELNRRQYRSWEMNASYTWSYSEGNGEDFNQFLGTDASRAEDEVGFQSTDQRHVVKFNAATITPWGFRLGGTAQWQSGLPWSILAQTFAFDAVPPAYESLGSYTPARPRLQYPTQQRNDQRNDSYWLFDLKATKEMNLGRGTNLQISAEVFNLLNEGVYQIYNPNAEAGFQVNGRNDARRLFGRRWQIGFKLAF